MRDYANEYEFDEDQRVILFHVLRAVDIWFLKEIQERADKKSGKDDPKRKYGRSGKKVLPIGQKR